MYCAFSIERSMDEEIKGFRGTFSSIVLVVIFTIILKLRGENEEDFHDSDS